MNDTERKQIKPQLLKCAKENENKGTFTGYVIVSSVCRAAVERIEELEKENAELKEKYKRLDNLEDFTFETYKSFKLDVKELARLFESRGYRLDGAYQENIKLQEQLTKAKKIIKDLLGSENTSCEEEMFFEIRQKAEQFLQENE